MHRSLYRKPSVWTDPSDASAPAPAQSTYPPPAGVPPANAAIAQTRAPNPYAQQNVAAAPAPPPGGDYNAYGAPTNNAYSTQAANPYGQQQQQGQYGQQQAYSTGGYANGAGGGDFWTELSATNQSLATLEQEIQAVRAAHQQSLVSCDEPDLGFG